MSTRIRRILRRRNNTPECDQGITEGIFDFFCGLAPTKAKAIKKLSEILVKDYGGKIPRTIEKLKKLPGVGHKAASVLAIHALKVSAFPVDTHIHRCAKRWKLSSGKSLKQTDTS